MKKSWLIFFLIVLIVSAACNEEPASPTPFPGTATPATSSSQETAQQVAISELAAAPETYSDSWVEVNGRYRKQPLLICETDRRPAPATWLLTDTEGNSIAVGGFDRELRDLIPEQLSITVVGYWSLWSGPVGCGKEAVPSQIWYLAVTEILSPAPLARVTLTPAGGSIADSGGSGDENGTGAGAATAPPAGGGEGETAMTVTAVTPTSGSSSDPTTPAPTPAATSSGAGTAGPTFTPTPTRDDDEDDDGQNSPSRTPTPTSSSDGSPTSTPTQTPSATPTSNGGSPNPTATSPAGGNPTPTSPGISATATPDPSQFDLVVLESIEIGAPIVELVAPNETNLHSIMVSVTEPVTVSVAGEPDQNIVLRLLDDGLNVIEQADNTQAGGVEMISSVQLTANEEYFVQVYTAGGTESSYCLTTADEVEWFPGDVIAGSLSYGDVVTNATYEGGIDYWCFMGETGEQITILNQPDDTSVENLYIGLHGPPNFGPLGDTYFDGVSLVNFTLPETGMFVIGVLDFESTLNNNYTLSLRRN